MGNIVDGSLESVIGTLTAPLRRIDNHLKRQISHNIFYGADVVPAMVRPVLALRGSLLIYG